MDAAQRNRWLEVRGIVATCYRWMELPVPTEPNDVIWHSVAIYQFSELSRRLDAAKSTLPAELHEVLLGELIRISEWFFSAAMVNAADAAGVDPDEYTVGMLDWPFTAWLESCEQLAERVGLFLAADYEEQAFFFAETIGLDQKAVHFGVQAAEACEGLTVVCNYVAGWLLQLEAKHSSGGSDSGPKPQRSRNVSVNSLMIEILVNQPEANGWTVREWSENIPGNPAPSTIHATATWRELNAGRQQFGSQRREHQTSKNQQGQRVRRL